MKQIDPLTSIVFCTDAMLAGCGFVPHFTTMIERLTGCYDMVQARARDGSRLIATPVVNPTVAEAFAGKCLWWLGSDPLYQWLSPGCSTAYCGRSSGVLSVAAALLAGCNPIYLVGHDLAYAEGRTHASSAHALAPVGHNATATSDSHIHHMKRYQVPSSHDVNQTVETCGLFQVFRQDIEHIIRSYPDRSVVNVGGLSHIAGTINGELPHNNLIVRDPVFDSHPLKNWQPEIPRIIENIRKLQHRCGNVIMRLEMDADTAAIAESMAMSAIVDADLIQLFQYIFRTLAHNLNLRLHYRATHGYDHDKEHRSVIYKLASTTYSLCERMAEQLA